MGGVICGIVAFMMVLLLVLKHYSVVCGVVVIGVREMVVFVDDVVGVVENGSAGVVLRNSSYVGGVGKMMVLMCW